jgi:hypothetical protein
MSDITGKCLCGGVTFKADKVDAEYGACHCKMCRQWSSGPYFATHVYGISFDGEDLISRYSSSQWAERGFCSACGTNLFYRVKDGGDYIMSVGTFDDHVSDNFKLIEEIFVDQKSGGYEFAGDHPRKTEAEARAEFLADKD